MRVPLFRVTALCGCAALAACALTTWQQADDARRPEALLDAYLIAHGMAASYANSPAAKAEVVIQLRTLDIKAAQAIRDMAHGDSAGVAATVEAVAALTDYAAHQSTEAQ